jgi:hypothetical protein
MEAREIDGGREDYIALQYIKTKKKPTLRWDRQIRNTLA